MQDLYHQPAHTLTPKDLYRDYFKANAYTIWVHGPLGLYKAIISLWGPVWFSGNGPAPFLTRQHLISSWQGEPFKTNPKPPFRGTLHPCFWGWHQQWIWVILQIRVRFGAPFTRLLYYVWDLKRGPNLENYLYAISSLSHIQNLSH